MNLIAVGFFGKWIILYLTVILICIFCWKGKIKHMILTLIGMVFTYASLLLSLEVISKVL